MKNLCKICKSPFSGRTDKIFCTVKCKTVYHEKLTKVTYVATTRIDKILHRNRSTFLEIMKKNSTQKKVDRVLLDAKKFNWHYITNFHINSKNKTVNNVYDFSWIIFSDQEILIKRIRQEATRLSTCVCWQVNCNSHNFI